MISRLWVASLVVCGLFLAEDPTVIAVRARLDGSSNSRVAGDIALAVAMIGYNFAASRYVVSVASAPHILDAMSEVDRRRGERIDNTRRPLIRVIRRVIAHLNPFELIKVAGEHLGRSIERATSSVRHRRLHRVASVLEDLSVVNLLGVPGAGLALGSHGRHVSRRHSLRHCVLFVGSWFIGIRCIEWLLDHGRRLPIFGSPLSTGFRTISASFDVITDIRHPIGAVFVAALTLAIVRYAAQVEFTARRLAVSGVLASAASTPNGLADSPVRGAECQATD